MGISHILARRLLEQHNVSKMSQTETLDVCCVGIILISSEKGSKIIILTFRVNLLLI